MSGPQQRARPGDRHDRRTFMRRGLLAGGALAGTGAAIWAATNSGGPRAPRRPGEQPNILVIVVDQLRSPQWFSPQLDATRTLPNLARLRDGAVSFARHYTASNDCTPARATLLTGLYTHQTGCMITGSSTLSPGFPTWGTMLREHGYDTRWYGKWHLTFHDGHWTRELGAPILESYGFSGGTYPSPNGGPGQGWRVDPHIVSQFAEWYAHERGGGPWCTTVSLVNPHDISWWYAWTDRERHERRLRRSCTGSPQLRDARTAAARHKPRLQRSLQETSASSFGGVPFSGPDLVPAWLPFLDLYVKLQQRRRPQHRRGHADAPQQAGGRGEHRRRLHLRPRRVRRLPRHARQGRRGLRGGHPRAPDRQGPARQAHARASADRVPSSPRASTWCRCC